MISPQHYDHCTLNIDYITKLTYEQNYGSNLYSTYSTGFAFNANPVLYVLYKLLP